MTMPIVFTREASVGNRKSFRTPKPSVLLLIEYSSMPNEAVSCFVELVSVSLLRGFTVRSR